jgi:hypothetical protein
MRKKKMSIKFILILTIIFLIWGIVTTVDYRWVAHEFKKPIFAQLNINEAKKDGGSSTYRGLGYSFVIKGNFMPEDELPGVTYAEFYLLGKMISSSIRD